MHHPTDRTNTYHSLCYTSRGALAGTKNSSSDVRTTYPSEVQVDANRVSLNTCASLHLTSTLENSEPVLHDWCNKGRGMCYHVCGIMHIK